MNRLSFGAGELGTFTLAAHREWLVTNGLGGYACGTLGGALTRRYHGLLVAALKPPVGRSLLLAKLEESAELHGLGYGLSANRWASGSNSPEGYRYLVGFRLEQGLPVWTFSLADALLEKRVWMAHQRNLTFVQYHLRRASAPLRLSLRPLVNHRDHHGLTRGGEWQMQVAPEAEGLRVLAHPEAAPIRLHCPGAQVTPSHAWYREFYLLLEEYRGLDAQDDHLCVGDFSLELQPGERGAFAVCVDEDPIPEAAAALAEELGRRGELLRAAALPEEAPEDVKQLVLAADSFVVRRTLPDGQPGVSLVAGYPWFGDWGRDSMIALPGLLLCTGRVAEAAQLLRTYAAHTNHGLLPNRFPDGGESPEYNTCDATLWFFEALRAWHAVTGETALLRELYPTLLEILDWHRRGTRHGIAVDPKDGLLRAGEPGVQLTWMDAKVGDWVVTPRIGKPVEVNALWHNALCIAADVARLLRKPHAALEAEAAKVRASFARFYDPALGWCADVLDGPDGHEWRLRPNQLLAVSLPHSPLDAAAQRGVLTACARQLLTPHGLRSLAGSDPDYQGRYGGDPHRRDGAYHQGTVWAWLIGPFVQAHLRVHGDATQARSHLEPLLAHLANQCVGSIAEIFDGDPPHQARGAFAQAWSVAEVLRAWLLTQPAGVPAGAGEPSPTKPAVRPRRSPKTRP